MLQRVAHLFGFRKKDEALEKRFATLKARYGETCREDIDLLTHVRSSFRMRTVVGASSANREAINQSLLEAYTRTSTVEREKELVSAK